MADQFSNIEVNESGDGCYRHVDDWVQLRFGDGYKVSVTVNETDFVRYTVIPRKPSLSGVDGEPITSSVYNRFRVKAWNSEGELVLDEVYKTGDVLTDDHDPDLEYMMLSCAVEYDHDTQALTEEIDIEHPLHLHTMNVTYGPKARNGATNEMCGRSPQSKKENKQLELIHCLSLALGGIPSLMITQMPHPGLLIECPRTCN
jgi:hypothetical protein